MTSPLIALAGNAGGAAMAGAGGSVLSPILGPVSQLANAAIPTLIPPMNEMILSYLSGNIGHVRFKTHMLDHGAFVWATPDCFKDAEIKNGKLSLRQEYMNAEGNLWTRVIQSHMYAPSIAEILDLTNQQLITPELAEQWILPQVGGNRDTARTWMKRRYEIPGPSDLIRFAVREGFNPQLVQEFGYHKETPLAIKPWMEKQGYGQSIGISIPPGGTDSDNNPVTGNASWFDLYWWSHWDLPSLTQGYEMLHRLYPSSDYGPSPDIIGDGTFDGHRLEMLQKAQDVPQYWRQRLQAISYHPLNKIDVQHLFANRMIDDAGYYHALRQSGYNDANAKKLIDLGKLERDRNLGVDPGKMKQGFICEAFKSGVIGDAQARAALERNGYSPQQAREFVQKCVMEWTIESNKEQTRHLKHAYLMGIYNDQTLEIEMTQLGFTSTFILGKIQTWRLLKNVKTKMPSTRMLMTYYKSGIITAPVFTDRLYNLGYPPGVVSAIVAQANLDIQHKQNIALAKQTRAMLIQQKAAAALALKAQKEALKIKEKQAKIVTNKANKRLRGFIRASSDANIKAWFKDKLIELWEVYYRLYYKDYLIADADKWVRHNMKDLEEDDYNAATQKAQTQYISEGNPPLA